MERVSDLEKTSIYINEVAKKYSRNLPADILEILEFLENSSENKEEFTLTAGEMNAYLG